MYGSKFQTDGALTQNAFADNVSNVRSTRTVSNSLSADVICMSLAVLLHKSINYGIIVVIIDAELTSAVPRNIADQAFTLRRSSSS